MQLAFALFSQQTLRPGTGETKVCCINVTSHPENTILDMLHETMLCSTLFIFIFAFMHVPNVKRLGKEVKQSTQKFISLSRLEQIFLLLKTKEASLEWKLVILLLGWYSCANSTVVPVRLESRASTVKFQIQLTRRL